MRALMFLAGFLVTNTLFAQTGPAGVGNSTSNSLWLKADAGTSTTANGTAVSSWNDVSGNNNHATQATSNNQPIYTSSLMNAMPAIFFDNAASPNNDLMTIVDADNLDNTNGLTILTVSRPTSIDAANARALISKRVDVGNNESYCLFYYTANHINVDLEGNDNRFATVTTFNPARDYVFSVLYDGTLAAGSRVKSYVNETVDGTTTESAATISNFASPVNIGSMNIGDGRPFGGYICEVIIYTKALNNVERIIAHNYLFAKYGLSSTSIPATVNDIYSGDNTANGDYDFEMGGIGTDATGSNTSASSSVTGGMAMTQVSGFENGDYVLYGHTAGSNDSQITDVGGLAGTNRARWSRIWYLDITNASTVEIVNISFDMSDGGTPVTPVTASNYVLLKRAGLSGNWVEVGSASSIVGDVINFNNVTANADAYYTLGTRNYVTSPLPVSLLDFSGEFSEKGVELTWSTATESNNDHFTIQRSADGEDFKTIATVLASGNSFKEVTYTAFDAAPFAGRTYYRLLQTDMDGKTTNLKTIAVRTSEPDRVLEAIPNPSNGNFWFDLPAGVSGGELKILNSAGQPVPFNYSVTGTRISVDAQALPRGLYLLKLVSDRGMHSAKFVVE